MGSPRDETERQSSEGPRHQVTVPEFWLGKYAVTQAQWRFVAGLTQVNVEMPSDPSSFKGDNRPVERVSWYEAEEFCARLSVYTGRKYRLPSEAEWEYACRAGTETPFHFGATLTTDIANYDGSYTYGYGPKGRYRKRLHLWDVLRWRMTLGCTTCMAMCGNGVRTIGMKIIRGHQRMEALG